MKYTLATLLIVALAGSALATGAPGAKVSLSQTGLTYMKDVGVEILLSQLASVDVPSMSGKVGTPVGSVDYSLSNIKITGLALPDAALTLKPGVGLAVNVAKATCKVSLNWHYREHSWPHVSGSGSADVSVADTSVAVTIAVGEADSRPTVAVSSAAVGIGSFSIKVHGGASWLYNWLVGLFKGSIKSSVQSSLKAAIISAINEQAEHALATIPISQKIDQYSAIDYAMLAAPTFTATTLTSTHLAQFIANAPAPPPPWAPVALPDFVNASREINLVFATDVALSAGFVYYNADQLRTTVTSLPSWSPVSLNTTSFKFLLPALYRAFPDMDMQFELIANATPSASVSPTGATCHVTGNVIVSVVPKPGELQYAFTLGLDIYGTGKVAVSKSNITAVVSFVGCDITLTKTSSEVGQFNAGLLSDLVNLAISKGLVPWINKALGVGFPIPVVDGITLSNIDVVYGTGYVGLASDFAYTPPKAPAVPAAPTKLVAPIVVA